MIVPENLRIFPDAGSNGKVSPTQRMHAPPTLRNTKLVVPIELLVAGPTPCACRKSPSKTAKRSTVQQTKYQNNTMLVMLCPSTLFPSFPLSFPVLIPFPHQAAPTLLPWVMLGNPPQNICDIHIHISPWFNPDGSRGL